MYWDGVSGLVATIANTVLPIVFNPADDNGPVAVAPIGPAVAYVRDGNLNIANLGNGSDNPPISFDFLSPASGTSRVHIQLPYASEFIADRLFTQFANGWLTVGATDDPAARRAGGAPGTLLTFAYQPPIADGETVFVSGAFGLALSVQLVAAKQLLMLIAEGEAGRLGDEYAVIATNTAARTGMRSGPLAPGGAEPAATGSSWPMSLPSGIDFSDGIFGLYLQIPVPGGADVQPAGADIQMSRLSDLEMARLSAAR